MRFVLLNPMLSVQCFVMRLVLLNPLLSVQCFVMRLVLLNPLLSVVFCNEICVTQSYVVCVVPYYPDSVPTRLCPYSFVHADSAGRKQQILISYSGFTRPRMESMIYHTLGEHVNHYNTEETSAFKRKYAFSDHTEIVVSCH